MGLIDIYVHSSHKRLEELLIDNNLKLDKIMATLKDLSDKVDELQASLDAEQAQIIAAVAGLEQAIADLQVLVADAGTAEERQAILDKLDAIKTDLEGTSETIN